MVQKNVALRTHLFSVASEQPASLGIAKEMVTAEFRNGRVMLRRNHPQPPAMALEEIKRLTGMVEPADPCGTLLGIEGEAVRVCFAHSRGMIETGIHSFDFRTRNRRPPKDPVNAVLPFLHSMLMRQAVVSAMAVGFEPYKGFHYLPR